MTTQNSESTVSVAITGDAADVNSALRDAATSVQSAAERMNASLASVGRASQSMTSTLRSASSSAASSFLTVEQAIEAEMNAARNVVAPVAALEAVTKKTHLSTNALARELVTVVRNLLGVEPVVGQVGNVMGTMAIGAPLMIGILAGLAALAFAWEHVSEAAKKAKEDQDAAIKRAEAIRDKQRNPVLGNIPGDVTQLESKKQDLQEELRLLDEVIAKQKASMFGVEESKKDDRTKLVNEIGNIVNLIQHLHDEEDRLNKDHAEKMARDAEAAREKRLNALKEEMRKSEAIRADAAKKTADKAKTLNELLAMTTKVGDDALKRSKERSEERIKQVDAESKSIIKALNDATEAGEKIRKEIANEWKAMFDSIHKSVAKAIDEASTKTGFLREVFRSLWYDVVRGSANAGAQMVSDWAATELAKQGITKKSVFSRVADETWGAVKTIAIKSWEAIKWIAIEAAKAAASAWAALAGIPVIGPALAIGAAIATFAGVMALAKGIGGGGGSPGGGGAPSGSAARGGGSVTNVNITTMDSRGVRDLLFEHRDAVGGAVKRLVRDGALTPKSLGMA